MALASAAVYAMQTLGWMMPRSLLPKFWACCVNVRAKFRLLVAA